jgi:hypothetical protein
MSEKGGATELGRAAFFVILGTHPMTIRARRDRAVGSTPTRSAHAMNPTSIPVAI